MRKNRALIRMFTEMADMLDIEGVEWKPHAYRRAARGIDALDRRIENVYEKEGREGIKTIPGVGDRIADHIIEYLTEGEIEVYQTLKREHSHGLIELTKLEGMGPKRVRKLSEMLGIATIRDLEMAALEHRIREVPGFGEKSEEAIREAIARHRVRRGRMLLHEAMDIAEEVVSYIREHASPLAVEYVGSLRRMKETVGDIDILTIPRVPSDAKKIMALFVEMPGVEKVIAYGDTKSSVLLEEDGAHVDLRIVGEESHAAALQYFTGSKEHNIATRKIAIKKGYKLSEYGLFDKRTGERVPCRTEERLYKMLGLSYVPPELREMRGEIEAAQKGIVPELVDRADVRGDLHVHTTYSEGINALEEMVRAAAGQGYEYIAITDHSPSMRIAQGLSIERLKEQWQEIERLEDRYGIHILKGSEVDIRADGSLDHPDEILAMLDVVIASVHTRFGMGGREMTKRIMKAMDNRYVTVLGHPTGRRLRAHGPYPMDLERIFSHAAERGVALEVNGHPERLDLKDEHIIAARTHGVLFSVSTDAHAVTDLGFMRYAVGLARRGWLEKKNILNARPYRELKGILRSRK